MQHSTATALRVRASAAASTLLIHGLLLLLLFQEDRMGRHKPLPQRIPLDVWIHLPPPAPSETGSNTDLVPRIEQSPALRPRIATTITPQQSEDPAESVTHDAPASASSPAPVDWYGEAGKLAARVAENTGAAQGFGRPPEKMREPCPPRESSFHWSAEQKKYGLLPLPYMMLGERCVIGLGFFSCSLGALPEPDKHLFDDMQARRTPDSSVPHHESCD